MGCAEKADSFVPNQPTLPEFTPELTPTQQLTAAMDKTNKASSMELTFGLDEELSTQTVTVTNGIYESLLVTPTETVYYKDNTCSRLDENQTVSHITKDSPYTRQEIFGEIYTLFPDNGLVERFCSQPLTASPSNDGSFRYQLTELTVAQIHELIYGTPPQTPIAKSCVGTVSFTVNPEGYFSQLLISVYLPDEDETHTLQLTLSEINTTTVPSPHWLP